MKKLLAMLLCVAMCAMCVCAFAEPVEVNMWHYFDDTSETALSKQVEEYNASQDAIKVSLTYCSRQELYNQLSMGAVSPDNLPEIAMIDNPDVAAFISMGILQDITAAAAEWGEVDKFYQGPLGACYDGDPWDFPGGKAVPQAALPIFTVLTMAATGSEMDMTGRLLLLRHSQGIPIWRRSASTVRPAASSAPATIWRSWNSTVPLSGKSVRILQGLFLSYPRESSEWNS